MLFCLFHMAAIGLYALPASIQPALSGARKIVEPYLFITSQWQRWDLFAPNPPPIQVYRIEERAEGYWKTSIALTHENLGWWRSERELKTVTRLAGIGDQADPILARYIQSYCEELGLEPNQYIRLMLSAQARPDRVLTETACPEPGTGPMPIRFLQSR